MIKFIKSLFAPTEKFDLNNSSIFNLYDKIIKLQERVEKLEEENIGLTNALYECENRLESKIDNIHPVIYNIKEHPNLDDYTLGDK